MGKIVNYTTSPAKLQDKIVASDADTGETKNITPESIGALIASSSNLVYEAVISQSSTNAPTATEFPNITITDGVYAYTSPGVYTLTSVGSFTQPLGIILGSMPEAEDDVRIIARRISDDVIQIVSSFELTPVNGLISNLYIKIVFPS